MTNKVGIIGGAGAEGSHVAEIMKRAGLDVAISDINQEKAAKVAESKGVKVSSSEEIAASSDLVLFSVPIDVTSDVIRKYGQLVRKDAAMADLTSIKTKAMQAMLETSKQTEVFGAHLMYGPTVSPWGQNVLMIPGRIGNQENWFNKFKKIMEKNKAKVSILESAEKHDERMAVLQVLPHALAYVFLRGVRGFTPSRSREKEKSDTLQISDIESYSTLLFRLVMEANGRVVANPKAGNMYGAIQLENPKTLEVYDKIIRYLQEQKELVERGDLRGFEEIHKGLSGFFGEYAQAAQERTDREKGKSTGIQIVYEKDSREMVRRALREFRNAPKKYLEGLETTVIDTGDLSKLKKVDLIDRESGMIVGKPILAREVLHTAKDSSSGNYAFFITNRKDSETNQTLFFTPTVPEDLEGIVRKHPDRKRIQMFNKYHDPFLNLFDTWKRTGCLPEGFLVAFKSE